MIRAARVSSVAMGRMSVDVSVITLTAGAPGLVSQGVMKAHYRRDVTRHYCGTGGTIAPQAPLLRHRLTMEIPLEAVSVGVD